MNNHLHPVFQQARAPFAPKAPTFKGAAGNVHTTPMVVAKVCHHGPNDYRVTLTRSDWEAGIESRRFEHFGEAFGHALWFSRLSAAEAEDQIDKARRFALLRQ